MKIIIIILLSLSSLMTNAQNQELSKIYKQIDDIIEYERKFYYTQINNKSERIEQFKGYKYIYEPVYEYGKLIRQPLNRKYEKQVIKYLEKFKYDSIITIRKTIFDLIYSVGLYSKDTKIRQRAVNNLLDMGVAVLGYSRYDVRKFNPEDFNKKANGFPK